MALLTPETVFRRNKTMGVPDSGKHDPNKDEIIQLLNLLFGVSRGGWVVARTVAELNAITPENATDGGLVLTGAEAGYYDRDAAAWVFGRGFPDTFAKITLSGSGTAQTGIVGAGVSPASIEVFFAHVTTPNTGPMTLSVSGEVARQVVNLAGNTLSAGEWTGMVMFYLNDDDDYQLLIDAGAAAAAAASASASGASATSAAASSSAAGAASGRLDVGSFAELATKFVYSAPGAGQQIAAAGDVVLWRGKGFAYEVAASGATDADFDYTGGGGVKLYIAQGQAIDVQMFGAVPDGATDSTAAFVAAATHLLRKDDPGGTIWVRGHFEVAAASGGGVNFWDILAAEQGIDPSDNYLPNGKLVRGTYIAMEGDGYEASRVSVTGSGDAFVWGNFTAINDKRAMSGHVIGIDFVGPGAIGHTAQVIVDNGFGQSYTTVTNGLAGTTNTTTRCLVFEEVVPGTFVRACRFRYFQEAIHQTYGFGFVVDVGTDIQYCNIGAFFDVGVTTSGVLAGVEIEVCAVGVFMKNTSNCFVGAAIVEANLAGCDVLVWVSKYLTMDGLWNEGSVRSVVLVGDLTAPSLPNSGFTFRNMVGLNIDSNGGVTNLRVVDCAMNNLVDTYVVNGGERFSNIVYENCTFEEGGFDLDKLSVQAGYEHHVRVTGPTINKSADNFVHREPLRRSGTKVATSNATPNTVFSLTVLNEETQGRVVIEGQWIPGAGSDYERVTFRYVGVIKRSPGTATVVEFSTTESVVTRHTGTGSNVQDLPAVPNVTISGAIGTTQTAGIEFALGTAVSGSANTVWRAELEPETDGLTFV